MRFVYMEKERVYVVPCLYRYVHHFILWLLLVGGLSSCVTSYSYIFTIKNQTDEDITITIRSNIPDYRIQVHNCYKNGSYNRYYDNKYDTVFMVPPQSDFIVETYWESRSLKEMISPQGLSDMPEFDGVTPAWKFIKRIELSDSTLPSFIWNVAEKWSVKEIGGYRKEYTLIIDSLSQSCYHPAY